MTDLKNQTLSESLLKRLKSQFKPNRFGICNMLGNVSEMIMENGKAKGGNWGSVGSEINVSSVQLFTDSSAFIGFRPVLIIK